MSEQNKNKISEVEFIGILALLMAISAYSIDAMLPALGIIGKEFKLVNPNDAQLIISALFIGLMFGQVVYGPLSDSTGRRRAIFLGLIFFVMGSLFCIFSENMTLMLIGRVLQGFGASCSRIVSMALVRDKLKGDAMARVMSFVTTVFIVVPAIAPTLGQLILKASNWRVVFVSQLLLGVFAVVWFGLRVEETLPVEKRKKFSFAQLSLATKITFKTRSTMFYALATGFIYAAFLGYLNSAQQLYQDYFQLGDRLPIFFGILSIAIGSASFANSQLVLKYGMRNLVWLAGRVLTLVSLSFLIGLYVVPDWINLTTFMITMSVVFFCAGILFGNLSSLALEPLGEIAGTASAVIGTIQSFISVSIGLLIGQMYNGTLMPLILGFAFMGMATLAALYLAKPNVQSRTDNIII
jgi:MFS transporter, DHA1 family, multidrug resistance protein